MNKQVFSLFFLLMPIMIFGQVGVGTNNVDPSAKFQIETSNKGFLQPRIALTGTTDVVTIASPATGLMVYNTATAGSGATAITPGVHYFDGTKWVRMESTVVNAGTGTTVTGSGTTANPYIVNSSGGGSSAVYVAGGFLQVFDGSPNLRPITVNGFYRTSKALKCGFITLPVGKWEVHVNNTCEIASTGYYNVAQPMKMMYWLQNDSITYDITPDGRIPSAIPSPVTSQADYYKYPPIGGGDTLFKNSATFMESVHPANSYHKGSFFIYNNSGADKTYYLFASDHIVVYGLPTNASNQMPHYDPSFAGRYTGYNRIYATKIE